MREQTNPFEPTSGKYPTCMEMLQLILDGEVTEDQKKYFKAHMDQCMPCFKSHEVDMAIKQLVKDRCCGEGAPTDLVHEIKNKIAPKKS